MNLTQATAAMALVTAAAIAGVTAASGTDDPSLDQRIDADQPIATDQAVLSEGHVDLGPRFVDDAWALLIHDDHADPAVWRTASDTVFQVGDVALTTVPDSPDYAFLPAEPGTDVHVVPQAEQPGVVWVGWNTQDPTVMDTIDRGATLSLRGVQGPGELVMFLQSGTLGSPDVLWDSREGYPQDIWVDVNTHTHANWVFAEPGVYLVEVEVSAALVSGETVSDTQVLRFAVGDATSTDEALAAEYVPAADAAPRAEATPASSADGSGGSSLPLVVGGAVAVVLAVALVAVLLRARNVKRRALTE